MSLPLNSSRAVNGYRSQQKPPDSWNPGPVHGSSHGGMTPVEPPTYNSFGRFEGRPARVGSAWYLSRAGIREWLVEVGCPQFQELLEEHKLDGQGILTSDRFDWRDLAFPVMGHRLRLQKAVRFENELKELVEEQRQAWETLAAEQRRFVASFGAMPRFALIDAAKETWRFPHHNKHKKGKSRRSSKKSRKPAAAAGPPPTPQQVMKRHWEHVQLRQVAQDFRPRGVKWTLSWLESIGMKSYAPLFARNGIDGAVLLELSEGDLQEMGIKRIGHAKRISKAISFLKQARHLRIQYAVRMERLQDQRRQFIKSAESRPATGSSSGLGGYGSMVGYSYAASVDTAAAPASVSYVSGPVTYVDQPVTATAPNMAYSSVTYDAAYAPSATYTTTTAAAAESSAAPTVTYTEVPSGGNAVYYNGGYASGGYAPAPPAYSSYVGGANGFAMGGGYGSGFGPGYRGAFFG